jgi:hypothetical protein
MDPEGRFDAESALQALLLWPEVGARLLHGDHLGSIDFIGVSVGDDGRRTFGEGVLHPICAIAIRERDQEAFAVLDRDDGRVEGPTRSASDVTNDRGVRSALSGRSEREGPRQSRETAQGALDRPCMPSRLLRSGRGVEPKAPAKRTARGETWLGDPRGGRGTRT